ncbi:MAG TPA: response regulator [Aggregicoccus sp.]|nr:response regulator [Aggregicoccus sp.]
MTTVLVVDDEFDILEAVKGILELEGYRVLGASNGAQALSAMQQTLPDLVLADLMMPVMDGLELLKTMGADERLSQVPVVLMSALKPRVEQREYGWRAFLQKPFDLDALLAQVHEQAGPP